MIPMRERFKLDPGQNILFIDFAGLRIDSRDQVDVMSDCVREAYEGQGRRIYAIVNYEGTEIAPELIDYYGERIKELADKYGIGTVRYSSSGFTRSMLRYLGAAKDLESNIFATREEAIDAISEIDRRRRRSTGRPLRFWFDPRRSLLALLMAGWLAAILAALMLDPGARVALASIVAAALFTAIVIYYRVIRPVGGMRSFAYGISTGGDFSPMPLKSRDEVGELAGALNDTARQLRSDIERLSGLYHISLMLGTGTELEKISGLLTRKIARLLDAEMCLILLYDEREKVLSAQLPGYGVSDEKLKQLRIELSQQSIAIRVHSTGEPYLTNDAASDSLICRDAARMIGVRELLAVPLQAGDRKFGILEVINKPGGFHEEDRQLVTIFAAQAAQVFANARLIEQVIASERLAAVGELVAGVAHEVRNPLFGITTTLKALERRLEDREVARPFIDVVMKEAEQLNRLMEQLLEHSRPARMDSRPGDVASLIREAAAEFRALADERDIAIECELPDRVPLIGFDRRKMYSVFNNLIDNALNHVDAGGMVRIGLAEVDGSLVVRLSDDGPGIPEEHIDRIFEPFFTTRSDGTGLGLAITRKAVHDHGGTIVAISEPGGGAIFEIRLPVDRNSTARDAAGDAAGRERSDGPLSTSRLRP